MERYSRDAEGNLILDPNGTLDAQGNPIQNPADTSGNTEEGLPQWLVMANRAAAIERENEDLKRRLAANNPAPPPPQLGEGEMYTQPNKAIDIIEQRLRNQIAPLTDFVTQQNRVTVYAQHKNQIKASNPNFSAIEAYVDQRIQPILQQRDVTLQDVIDATVFVVGQLTLSGAFNQRPAQNTPPANPQNTTQNPPPNLPAHLRPSAPPRGGNNNSAQELDYEKMVTEDERRLMREQGMSAKHWVMLRDAAPHELTSLYAKIKKGEI